MTDDDDHRNSDAASERDLLHPAHEHKARADGLAPSALVEAGAPDATTSPEAPSTQDVSRRPAIEELKLKPEDAEDSAPIGEGQSPEATGPVSAPASANPSELFRMPDQNAVRSEPIDILDLKFEELVFNLDDESAQALDSDRAVQEAIFASIAQRSVQRSSFTGFLNPKEETRAPFEIVLRAAETTILHALVTAVLPSKPSRQSVLRLILDGDHLILQSNESITLLQHRIDLPEGTGLDVGKNAIFYISAWDLDKALRASEGDISLSWSGGNTLVFSSGAFDRDIVLRSPQQFTPYSNAPMSMLSDGGFSMSALRKAANYARPLIEEFTKNAPEPAIIELRADGTFCAGAPRAVCVIRDQQLAGCTFSMRGDHLPTLEAATKVLQEPVQIFDDGRHHIFWDGATAIGWDRSARELGDVYRQLDALEWGPTIRIPRPELMYSIMHLENLSGADKLQLLAKGFGKLQLQLSAESQVYRRASRRVDGYADAAVLPDRVTLPIWPLMSALRGNASNNAEIRRAGHWVIVDDRESPSQGSCCFIAGSTPKR